MKRYFLLIIILSFALPAWAVLESFGPEYDEAVIYFQSEEEPEVMDAIWTSEELLQVGVIKHDKDDSDVAEHACDVLRDKGFQQKELRVQVIDIQAMIKSEDWTVIGRAACR